MAYETSFLSITIKDYSADIGTSKMNLGLITAANMADRIAERDAVIDAIEACIDGVIQRSNLALTKNFNSNKSSIVESDTDKKMHVFMSETGTGRPYDFTIPCRKALTATFRKNIGTDEMDLTGTEIAALVTALNGAAVSPWGGAGTVARIVLTA